MLYEIKRHGGRSSDKERVVYTCKNREEAFFVWKTLWLDVRQGSLLIYEDGICIYEKTEPNLRTGW